MVAHMHTAPIRAEGDIDCSLPYSLQSVSTADLARYGKVGGWG